MSCVYRYCISVKQGKVREGKLVSLTERGKGNQTSGLEPVDLTLRIALSLLRSTILFVHFDEQVIRLLTFRRIDLVGSYATVDCLQED